MNIDDLKSDIAFQSLANGPISMYHDVGILNEDLEWYRKNNYRVFDLDTTNWTVEQAHLDLKEKMDFPEYYGKNLDAFNDCLGDIYDNDFKGQVIVFRHFDSFSKKQDSFCSGLLDSIARNSRSWLLTGQRLIGIVQSDDPRIFYPKVGGVPPYWNKREWFDASRIK